MKKHFIFIPVLFLFVTGFSQTGKEFIKVNGGVEYSYIGTYDTKKLSAIISTELDAFMGGSIMPPSDYRGKLDAPKYPVKLYRVKYRTVIPEYDNYPAVASGLVAIPETGKDSMPMISYQHGTVFSKTDVPSFPDESIETKLMLAQFGAQGYIIIGADYPGMGTSDLPNSYLIRESSEQACVDMYYAALDVLAHLKKKSGPFFVHGWSQGGWTTMTFLRKLEYYNIPVVAAATAAAPVDAAGIINRWMNNYQPGDAIWLPACATNFIFAREYYNKMPGLAKRAIRPEYYQAAKDFYEFKMDWPTYRKLTKDRIQDVFNPEFIATGNSCKDEFWKNLEQAEAYRWRCRTPLVNYYGEGDEVIAPYVARLAEGWHTLVGFGKTKAVNAGPKADHRGTYVYSLIHVKDFFAPYLK